MDSDALVSILSGMELDVRSVMEEIDNKKTKKALAIKGDVLQKLAVVQTNISRLILFFEHSMFIQSEYEAMFFKETVRLLSDFMRSLLCQEQTIIDVFGFDDMVITNIYRGLIEFCVHLPSSDKKSKPEKEKDFVSLITKTLKEVFYNGNGGKG